MTVTEEVIYHNTYTCDHCGGIETRTDVTPIDGFRPIALPDNMSKVWFDIGGIRDGGDIHKVCIKDWLLSKIPT